MSRASSAGNVIRPKNKLKKFSHWGSGERVIPHSRCCVHSVSCSHREQSLAYKRRIPQADSRPNPHRARFKLKGHSLVFSRPCYACVCGDTQFNKCHRVHVGIVTLSILEVMISKWGKQREGWPLALCLLETAHRGSWWMWHLEPCDTFQNVLVKQAHY